MMAGEIDRGVEYLLRSLELARAHDHESRISSALGMLGTGLGEMYELERSQHYLEQHIAFGEERDLLVAYSRSWLACVHAYRGRWDEATALARAVLTSGHPISEITSRIALGRVRARRGDPGAFDVLDEALELAQPGGHLQRLGHVHAARAEAAWLTGSLRAGRRGGARRVSARAREAPPLVRGRARVLAVEGGCARGRPGLDRGALPASARRAARDAAEAWRARGCPLRGGAGARGGGRRRRPARGAGRVRPPRRRTGCGRAAAPARPSRAARGDARGTRPA